MTTIAFDSLGCKLNQAEIETMARDFVRAGYRLVAPEDGADIYVLNTCTITHVADRKSRHLLRLARRRNPNARLVVTGCYAERAGAELQRIEGVTLVVGNDRKSDLRRLLEAGGDIEAVREGETPGAPHHRGRTRAFIKIQDGCRNFCAYCIVPLVRRHPDSVPAERVISGINARAGEGYREVVLTGTEVGTYSSGETDLKQLLERILRETQIERVRLSSLQPPEIAPGLVGLWRNPRLCPHFHLSLQSGSDTVLARMNRRYDTAAYAGAVAMIREAVPDVAITTDVIVGFPGETGAEFSESLDFCRRMQFARIHVFSYSPRPGTAASAMPGQVAAVEKQRRCREMLALAGECQAGFNGRYRGAMADVLWEQRAGGIWSGYTGNYIKVYARSLEDLTNRLLPVRLGETCREGLWGELRATAL